MKVPRFARHWGVRISVLLPAVLALTVVAAQPALAWNQSTLTKGVRDVTSGQTAFTTATTASPGDTIEYQLVYHDGNGLQTGLKITDPVPAHSTFVSCTGGCTTTGNTPGSIITWHPPTMNTGDNFVVLFQVRLDASFPPVTTVIPNTAKVTLGSSSKNSNKVTVTVTPGCLDSQFSPNPAGAHASGGAYGLQLTSQLLNQAAIPSTTSSQSGLGTDGHNANLTSLSVPGVATIGVLPVSSTSSVTSQPSQADDTSVAETATVNLFAGAITADVVRASSEAIASGTGSAFSDAGSTFNNLKVNGQTLSNVTPNTQVSVAGIGTGAFVILKEEVGSTSHPAPGQLSGGTYSADLSVNMIHVHIPGIAGLQATDLIVSHSQAHADFPQTQICPGRHPQSVSGHAFNASEATAPSVAPVLVGFVSIPTSGGNASQSAATLSLGGVVTGGPSSTSSVGTLNSFNSTASSKATVTQASLLSGLVTADVLTTEANSTANGGGASSNPTGTNLLTVKVGANPVMNNPPPNTTITLPGLGFIILNEQIPDAVVAGSTGLTVRAIDLVVTFPGNPFGLAIGARIIVDEAHSDATFK